MKITPCKTPGPYKTGSLTNLTVQTICLVLGFPPNVKDDPAKVKNSWGFLADGSLCGIWDYKGSEKYGAFSTFGPKEVFEKLFPHNVSH